MSGQKHVLSVSIHQKIIEFIFAQCLHLFLELVIRMIVSNRILILRTTFLPLLFDFPLRFDTLIIFLFLNY